MRSLIQTLFVVLISTSASAEVVTTEDGRRLELKSDGTYQLLEASDSTLSQLDELAPFLESHQGEYNQNSMRFMPIFRNTSDRDIVGFKFSSEFKSAFGDVVFAFSGESSERVPAGSQSTASAFYFFEDNQFISGQPYDKLKIFEAAGTGKVTTMIDAIVFADGEVVRRN